MAVHTFDVLRRLKPLYLCLTVASARVRSGKYTEPGNNPIAHFRLGKEEIASLVSCYPDVVSHETLKETEGLPLKFVALDSFLAGLNASRLKDSATFRRTPEGVTPPEYILMVKSSTFQYLLARCTLSTCMLPAIPGSAPQSETLEHEAVSLVEFDGVDERQLSEPVRARIAAHLVHEKGAAIVRFAAKGKGVEYRPCCSPHKVHHFALTHVRGLKTSYLSVCTNCGGSKSRWP